MIEIIGRPAMLEQMAEECSELTQALLKEARVLRGENPTPVTEEEAEAHIREEWTDVMQCANELDMASHIDWEQMEAKTDRFFQRLQKAQVKLP